jgi:hypothetical protein
VPFPLQLPPHLAHAVDLEVLIEKTLLISTLSRVSRLTRAGAVSGLARRATWAWYVDGAIASTLQIGSTP